MGKREWRHTRVEGGDLHQERVLIEENSIEEEQEQERKDWAKQRRRDQETGKVEPGSRGKGR